MRLVSLLGLLLVLPGRGAAAEVMQWQVDAETREAIVYAPAASSRGEPLPLVPVDPGSSDKAGQLR